MTSKQTIIKLAERVKQLTPNIQVEFLPGKIMVKGKYTHRQNYTDVSEEGEEEACLRLLETIFLCGVFGMPESKKEES
jgi:hypothetical protein